MSIFSSLSFIPLAQHRVSSRPQSIATLTWFCKKASYHKTTLQFEIILTHTDVTVPPKTLPRKKVDITSPLTNRKGVAFSRNTHLACRAVAIRFRFSGNTTLCMSSLVCHCCRGGCKNIKILPDKALDYVCDIKWINTNRRIELDHQVELNRNI